MKLRSQSTRLPTAVQPLIFIVGSILLASTTVAAELPRVLIGWGNQNDAIYTPNDATNVVAVSAGVNETLWLNADGTVRYQSQSTLEEAYQPMTSGAATLKNIAAICMGYHHALALASNGTMVAWGLDIAGENTVPAGLSNVTAVAAGGHHNLALEGGRVVAWGDNRFGQLDVPAGLSNVIAISASKTYNSAHNVALKSDGTVVAWGDNFFGQCAVPVGLSNVVAISAGWYHNLALKSDGVVIAWGGDNPATAAVPAGLSGVTAISAGAWQNLALKADGTIVGWGAGTGDGNNQVPTSFTNAVCISAGLFHNLAVLNVGTPRITYHTESAGVYAGSDNTLWVGSKGVQPFNYQWQKDGVDLPGATNYLLYLTNVQTQDNGSYTVNVGNIFGTVTSEPTTLTIVPSSVEIGQQPANTSAFEGGDAVFRVLARGSEPLRYQWFESNPPGLPEPAAVLGATGPELTLTNIQGLDSHFYFVIVSNDYSAGWLTSRVARLTVTNRIVQPLIVNQPLSDSVFTGAKMGFTVSADGISPLSYQWRRNGVDLAGETNSNLSILSVQPGDAGEYAVYVSNGFGAVTSVVATLAISAYTRPELPPPGTVVDLGCALPLPAFTNVVAGGALVPLGLTNVVAMAAGRLHAVALNADGTVQEWGTVSSTLITNVPMGLSNVVGIAAADYGSYALLLDGTVVTWSFGTKNPPAPVPGVYGVITLSGQSRVLALKSDGRVVDIGNGQTLPGVSNAVAIAASLAYALAASADGTVAYFGPGPVALHPPTNTIAVAVGTGLLALTSDGRVDSFGFTSYAPPSDLSGVVAISSAYSGALALKNDGTVVGWGRIRAPNDLTGVSAIAAGGFYNLALTTNPPPPRLAAAMRDGQLVLQPSLSVSGYALEATDDLSRPYSVVNLFTNTVESSEININTLNLPLDGPRRFYRFRRF